MHTILFVNISKGTVTIEARGRKFDVVVSDLETQDAIQERLESVAAEYERNLEMDAQRKALLAGLV